MTYVSVRRTTSTPAGTTRAITRSVQLDGRPRDGDHRPIDGERPAFHVDRAPARLDLELVAFDEPAAGDVERRPRDRRLRRIIGHPPAAAPPTAKERALLRVFG